jgi:anti-sigma factor RsiW
MNDCRRIADLLTAYVDDVLRPDERIAVDLHLAACPDCRHVAAAEGGGHAALRRGARNLLAGPLPPGLRTRCEALVAAQTSGTSTVGVGAWWRMRLVPALLLAVLFVFTASALFSLATRRSDALLAAQLTADHSKCFRWLEPIDGTRGDDAAVHRLLLERYGRDVHVPPSSAADEVELIGARHCLYGAGLIPHVMYRAHGEDISFFVLAGGERRAAELVTLGHRSRIWANNGTTFVVVAPEGAGGVAAARYVMREAR